MYYQPHVTDSFFICIEWWYCSSLMCFILAQFDTLSPLFRVKGESKLNRNSLFPFWGCSGQAHDVWKVNHAESPEHFKLEWIQWLVPSAEQRSQPAAQHGWEELGLVENTVLPPLGHIRWPICTYCIYIKMCAYNCSFKN